MSRDDYAHPTEFNKREAMYEQMDEREDHDQKCPECKAYMNLTMVIPQGRYQPREELWTCLTCGEEVEL